MLFEITEGKFAGAQGTGEYRGRLSTLALTVANPDLVNDSGILVGQFLRRIHPRIDLGMEYVYQYGKQIPGGRISVLSYAARYNGTAFILLHIGTVFFHCMCGPAVLLRPH